MATNSRKLWRYLNPDGSYGDETWLEIGDTNPVKDKRRTVRELIMYMMDRTAQMFEYKGLPATMPKLALERLLQFNGMAIVAHPPAGCKPKGYGIDFNYSDLQDECHVAPIFAFYGSLGEAPDPYLAPFKAIVANPGFEVGLSKEYTINKDCVVVRNDTHMMGVLKLYRRYAWELADAMLSMRSALINLREQRIIVAATDDAYASVEAYLEKLEDGELAAIMDQPLLGKSQVFGAEGRANAVIQAIEAVQYIKSNWYNEMGLNASFNMKRQYISEQEIDANNDLLLPLVDDMLEARKIGLENINKMFGTEISVEKNSAWYNKEEHRDLTLEEKRNEANGEQVSRGTHGGDSGEA